MVAVTPTPDPIRITAADHCQLELRRQHAAGSGRRPVLLVHGASAASDTFRIGERQTLVDYLVERDLDVWTLDWRASKRCVQHIYCDVVREDPGSTVFTIDAAARHDVAVAIAEMRRAPHNVRGKIGLVGHCMGGAIVAQGIVEGVIPAGDVENVVITGLGLFYKAAIDNVLKAEDRVLERLLDRGQHLLHPTTQWAPTVCTRDPGPGKWDRLLQEPYEIWSATPLRHDCREEFCHRLSYMFGMPYLPDRIPGIHDGRHLPSQFGYIALQFLLHCCQNLRRGHAGRFMPSRSGATLPRDTDYLKPEAFRDRKLTLITGDLNSLWHRDSIDLMHEWLSRGRQSDRPKGLRKHVLTGYGHQDLYWAAEAPVDVFPLIAEGLDARRPV
jgi:cholesterol oxidase